MDRIIKIAAYFFCVIGSASLCAMELELQQSKEYRTVQKVLLCDEIMKKHEVPQDVAAVVKRDACCALRMDTIYKKFDSFFHFNEANYHAIWTAYVDGKKKSNTDTQGLPSDLAIAYRKQELQCDDAARKYAHEKCRKFGAIGPRHLFFFTKKQEDLLLSLIVRPRRFIHNCGDCRIELTSEEREECFMFPVQFRNVLSIYLRDSSSS